MDPSLPVSPLFISSNSTMVRPDVTPDAPVDEQPTIGLIGMGAMGKLYANCLSAAGWKRINVCDTPEMYESLRAAYQGSTSQPPCLQSWPIDVSQILLGLMFFPMDITSHELRILSCTPLRRRAFTTLLQSTGPVSYSAASESLRI
jgi:hypothetical protein